MACRVNCLFFVSLACMTDSTMLLSGLHFPIVCLPVSDTLEMALGAVLLLYC